MAAVPARRCAAARAVAGVAAVLTAVALAAPAHAAPVVPDDPAAVDGSVVLIVHTAGDVAAAVADAASPTIDVRHAFAGQAAFSVQVPARDRDAAEAALRATPGVTGIEAPVTRTVAAVPNDPQYGAETSYLSSVDAPAAWSVTHGSRSVRIAVIDTGIDVSHPDLKGKIVGTYDADDGGSTITDDVGHGTFVAGVAAAATNNSVGIAGAGYDTALLGIKIAGPDGELSVDDEIAGINWAVKNHAAVINLSLSGPDYSAAERTAVENAISKGVLVVAAAGNEADSVTQYPAAYPGVVAVGAVDTATHKRAAFSSHGSWVTLAAPGVGIRGTTPLRGSDFWSTRTGYAQADGTSFSAPLVAGAAALLKAAGPALTATQLRQALVASASGFAGQGLGAGQVDFARALTHVPPAAAPSSVSVSGRADRITLIAATTAPAVEFQLDHGSWTAPLTTTAGRASTPFATWGYANGVHTVHARACTRSAECGTSVAATTVDLANVAPTVVSPGPGSVQTGRFTVTAQHPTGGGARLLVDGSPTGFDASSPYAFAVNGSALTDGTHTVQVVPCTASGSRCQGPASATLAITTRSLHPAVSPLTHPAISPNGDRSGDTTALHFTLPDAESATVETVDAAGTTVRSDALGPLAAGAHVWTWRGLDARGRRLPDGRYTLALATRSTSDQQVALDGYAATAGTVDTVAPGLSAVTGAGSTFYPVRDGYRDTFGPGITTDAAGTVALIVRSSHGAAVRTLSADRGAGRTTMVWNGRDGHGRLVAAGAYRWQYSITDAAGNRRLAPTEPVTVSGERLVSRVALVTRRGTSRRSAGGTDACATARRRASAFRHGVLLRNACPPGTGHFAFASFRFTLPRALRYGRVSVQVYGRSAHRPAELSVAVDRVDGGLEIPAYVTVRRTRSRWYSVASVPAAGHVSGARAAYANVLLTGRYKGTNDFDLRATRLRVRYTVLA